MDEVTRWPHLICCVSKVGGFFFPPKLTGFPSPSFTQRISYCTADKMHDKVFAYIVQSQHNETLECHAFLCPKRKTVSQLCVFLSIFFKKKPKIITLQKTRRRVGERIGRVGTVVSLSNILSTSGGSTTSRSLLFLPLANFAPAKTVP